MEIQPQAGAGIDPVGDCWQRSEIDVCQWFGIRAEQESCQNAHPKNATEKLTPFHRFIVAGGMVASVTSDQSCPEPHTRRLRGTHGIHRDRPDSSSFMTWGGGLGKLLLPGGVAERSLDSS